MRREVERSIAAVAAGQHGVVTREQLLEAGLSSSAVTRRGLSGQLRPLYRGVYQLGPVALPNAREMAAVLACGRGALLSHVSGARLFMPGERFGASERSVDVTVERADRGHRRGIRVHRVARLDPSERTVRDGIPVTTLGRTLLDLAAVLGIRELEQAVARAERDGLITRGQIVRVLRRHRGRAGTRALQAVVEIPGGPAFTRSEAEVRFLSLVRSVGLPAPELNVSLGPYELDFLWRSARLAVEVDGYEFHGSRHDFEADRRKDAWLSTAGIHVLRLSWRQVTEHASATAVQVAVALARAGFCWE